jgi:predicted HicB family RNase H-like nuclease
MNKTIYVKDSELWNALKERAKIQGISMSTLIERALRNYLKNCERRELISQIMGEP